MEIITRVVSGVHILDCSGKLYLREGTVPLRTVLGEILKTRHRKIVLNLAGVDDIDTSGIGELASSYVQIEIGGGGRFVLLGIQPKVLSRLKITRLFQRLPYFDSEKAALKEIFYPIPPP